MSLITNHFHKKTSDLFKATTRLKDAGVSIHSIDFEAKRINIERPDSDQARKLGWSVIFNSAMNREEAKIYGFYINWEASKKIIEVTTSKLGRAV